MQSPSAFLSRARTIFSVVSLCVVIGLPSIAHSQGSPSTCQKIDSIAVQEYVGVLTNLPAWAAIDQGFFKKRCLEPKMLNFPSAPAAMAASLQGSLNFLALSPDVTYVGVSKGFDLKIVGFMNNSVHYALVVGKHVPLPNRANGYPEVMKDLVGKTIGVNAFGSTTDELAREKFRGAGLDPKQANWVAYGPAVAAIAGLQNQSLDAAEFFGDGMDIAVAAAGGVIVADFRDPGPKVSPKIASMHGVHTMWVTTAEFAKRNPDIVRRFVLANDEAIDWIRDPNNFEAVVRIAREKAPSPASVPDPEKLLRERVKRWIPQFTSQVSMRSLRAWSEWDVAVGRMPKPADIDGLLWETAVSKVVP